MRLPRLKEVREGHGWSQKKLAEESGVSRDSISNYETGQRHAWPATAKKLADALGVEIANLRAPTLEPALPKAEAPEAGQSQTSTQNVEEFQRALARVLEPVRTEALRERQAANRSFSSQGQKQQRIGDIAEAVTGNMFMDEFSSDERPLAFGEIALGYARLEQDNTTLQEVVAQGRKLLRERDEKIAQLEEENARLREEAGQESAHR